MTELILKRYSNNRKIYSKQLRRYVTLTELPILLKNYEIKVVENNQDITLRTFTSLLFLEINKVDTDFTIFTDVLGIVNKLNSNI